MNCGYLLQCGDCIELMKDLPEKDVDLVLIDPPYGVTACKWDSVIPLPELWERINRVLKPDGTVCIFGTEPFASTVRMSNVKRYKYDWVWYKNRGTGYLNAKHRPLMATENIMVFSYGKTVYHPPQMREREKPRQTVKNTPDKIYYPTKSDNYVGEILYKRYPLNILQFSKAGNKERRDHPSQKPVELLKYLIRTYTRPDDVVLDCVMGSGSTGVAAKETNRRFIGIEKDPGYFDVAVRRIENAINPAFPPTE